MLVTITPPRSQTSTWRQERTERGLTQAQVARAVGTSPTNISTYEVGTKTPNARTATRVETAIVVGADSPLDVVIRHSDGLLTVPACAAMIRRDLRAGERDSAPLLRHVAEMLSHAEPSTTTVT